MLCDGFMIDVMKTAHKLFDGSKHELIPEDRTLQNLKSEIGRLKMYLIKLNAIPLDEKDAEHNDALWYANKIISKKINKLKNKLCNE